MPDAAVIIWGFVCFALTGLIGVVGYFLKRTMETTDKHTHDINDLKQNRIDPKAFKDHGDKIRNIELTYVTSSELKAVKLELKEIRTEAQANNKEQQAELKAMVELLNTIKDNSISAQDYHRARIEDNRKIERIENILISKLGGE